MSLRRIIGLVGVFLGAAGTVLMAFGVRWGDKAMLGGLAALVLVLVTSERRQWMTLDTKANRWITYWEFRIFAACGAVILLAGSIVFYWQHRENQQALARIRAQAQKTI